MGNIIGNSFKGFVDKQVETRQKVLSSSFRDQNFLKYVSKTPWLRMASSVSITDSEINDITGEHFQNPKLPSRDNSETNTSAKENNVPVDIPAEINQNSTFYNPGREKAKDLGEPNALGNTFARNYVLFGGSMSVIRNDNSDDASPGSDISYSPLATKFGVNSPELISPVNPTLFNDNSYGFGGSDWGKTPMPGLTSIHLQDYNRGAIRKAKVNFTCTNLQQFEILSTLYMRVGYNVLLEWGHTQYLDEEGNITNYSNFSTPAFNNFFEGSDSYTILQNIQTERRYTYGNYDAFIGTVTNFNWRFANGVYECSIDVISQGDVIDSIKVNVSSNQYDQASSSPTADNIPTEKEEIKVNNDTDKNIPIITVTDAIAAGLPITVIQDIAIISLGRWFSSFYRSNLSKSSTTQSENVSKPDEETLVVTEQTPSFISSRDSDVIHQVLYDKYLELGKDSNAIKSSKGIVEFLKLTSGNTWNHYYVSLGKLLQILESNCLFYDKQSKSPIVSIDSDYGSNFCARFPEQVSTDWSKCFIPYEVYNATRNQSTTNKKINKILGPKDLRYDAQPYAGKLMHILVNFEFISSILKNSVDKNGKVTLLSFLNEILGGIQISMGGVNDFNVGYDYENNILKIYDNTPLASSQLINQQKPQVTKFASYGVQKDQKGSFLLDLNLEATISSNFANMIAVGAQANGNQVGENATAFSLLNLGLEDRTQRTVLASESYRSSLTETATQDSNAFNQLINNFQINKQKLFDLLVKISNNEKSNPDDLKSASKTNSDFANFYLGRAAELGKLPGNFFIPFNLNISMDGLSGMRLFDVFSITNEILPKMYTDSLQFIISGIGHDITSSGWVTNLSTQTYNQFSETNPTPLPLADPLIAPTKTNPVLVEEGGDTSSNLYPPVQEKSRTKRDIKTLAKTIVQTLDPLKSKEGITDNIMVGVLFLALKEQNLNGFNHNYYGVMTDISRWTGGEEYFNGAFKSTEGSGGEGERAEKFRFFASFENDAQGIRFIALALKRKGWSDASKDSIASKYYGSWLYGNPNDPKVQKLIQSGAVGTGTTWGKARNSIRSAKFTRSKDVSNFNVT